MLVDLLVQMLAALLADWKTTDSLLRIAQKMAQRSAVIAIATEFGVAGPVFRILNGMGRCRTQFRQTIGVISNKDFATVSAFAYASGPEGCVTHRLLP